MTCRLPAGLLALALSGCITRTEASGPVRASVPLGALLKPGDTVVVSERWF